MLTAVIQVVSETSVTFGASGYLDLAHAVEVMTVVRAVARGDRRTVVCVLHDLTLAARFADHVVVVDGAPVVVPAVLV